MAIPAHPEYEKKKRRALVVGSSAMVASVFGILLPIIPGVLFLLIGLSIFSTRSQYAHRKLAELRARHPELLESLEHMETWLHRILDLTTHEHEYIDIPIRGNRVVAGLIERSEIPGSGVAVLLHSASGTMETALSQGLAHAFRRAGYSVIRFDAYHGIDSHGAYALFSVTRYLEDLSDVCEWLRAQGFDGPYTLVGHSLGGLVAGLYAAEHPDDVQALYLVAPTLSGEAFRNGYQQLLGEEAMKTWHASGLREVEHPLSGERFGLGYQSVEDALQYDLVAQAGRLTMPVHVVAATDDVFAPVSTCNALCAAVGERAHCNTVGPVPHTPTAREDVQAYLNGLS